MSNIKLAIFDLDGILIDSGNSVLFNIQLELDDIIKMFKF